MISITRPASPVNSIPRGVVLYDGPSKLDGNPIVCVATLQSANKKTGPMIQTWILRADVSPVHAINTGEDASVCGDCPLRGRLEVDFRSGSHPLSLSGGDCMRNRGRGCYVRIDQAPGQVYSAFRSGSYPDYSPAEHAWLFRGRMLRLGSYGDPLAVPLPIIRPILTLSRGWTGYTHSWTIGKLWRWRAFVHASTHNCAESLEAIRKGWKCFQTVDNSTFPAPSIPDDFGWCLSSRGVTCEHCGACRGSSGTNRIIRAHGSPATIANLRNATEGGAA